MLGEYEGVYFIVIKRDALCFYIYKDRQMVEPVDRPFFVTPLSHEDFFVCTTFRGLKL